MGSRNFVSAPNIKHEFLIHLRDVVTKIQLSVLQTRKYEKAFLRQSRVSQQTELTPVRLAPISGKRTS